MKAYKYILAAAVVAMSLASCQDDVNAPSGEGRVVFEPTFTSDVKESRTSSDDLKAELGDSFKLWLYRTSGEASQQGVIRQYEGIDNLTDELVLKAGSYKAKAWAGDSLSASFTTRWFKGQADFDVTAGNTTQVAIECKIANVVVSVEYGEGVLDAYDIDSIYVSHKRGALSFKPDTYSRGYFMMPSNDHNLVWQFIGTRKSDGAVRTFNGTLENVKSAHEYKFKVTFTPNVPVDDDKVGGAIFDIAIDYTEETIGDAVVIEAAPMIEGIDFDINDTYITNEEAFNCSAYITTTSALKEVKISCADFPTLIKNSPDAFELFNLSSSNKANINGAGITWQQYVNAQGENLKLTFGSTFTSKLDFGKVYNFEITAKDVNDLATTQTLQIIKSQNPVSVEDAPNEAYITPTSYTVTGNVMKDLEGNDVVVNYREANSRSRADEWRTVVATVSGNKYTAELTGLRPGIKYEYKVVVGDFESGVVAFQTEAPQLPNCGFEEWQTSSTPYLIYAAGGEMFWDSGNHGSATMKKNVTVPDNTIKHSGDYSIKLASQFVGVGKLGKFAAGNVFIGKYLGTEGTDGILGFGRPFTYSPTKVKGYVRYEPKAISDVGSDAPAEYVKGEMDKGIIYVALLDNTATEYDGALYPAIIKTKTKELFDKNGSNVIAYGEIVFTEQTAGTGMVEFEITLDYKRPGVTPSYIMLTASASKGGDYFTGGNGSNMWLDDLELVYE